MRCRLGIAVLVLLAGCGDEGRRVATTVFDRPPIDFEPAPSTQLLACGFSSISPEGVVATSGCP